MSLFMTPRGPDDLPPHHIDVVVVGAGIAGLATARALRRRKLHVVVLEREPAAFMGASGRNAAIFRHAEPSQMLVELVRDSRSLLDALCAGARWLDQRGAVYLSRDAPALHEMRHALAAVGVVHHVLTGRALEQRVPHVVSRGLTGLFVPDDGVIDLDIVRTRLLDLHDATLVPEHALRLGARVIAIESGNPVRVSLESGETIVADAVVIAAGAHTVALTSLPLTPVRRHLMELKNDSVEQNHPVVWRLDEEVYYRPGPSTLVASPCDEERCAPDDDSVRESAVDAAKARLTSLLGTAPVIERVWACLRTWAPDRFPIAGALPGADGVFVVGGLGGVGVSAGMAVAEHAARAIADGTEHPALTPARFAYAGGPHFS